MSYKMSLVQEVKGAQVTELEVSAVNVKEALRAFAELVGVDLVNEPVQVITPQSTQIRTVTARTVTIIEEELKWTSKR